MFFTHTHFIHKLCEKYIPCIHKLSIVNFQFYSLSLDNKNRQPEERRTEAEKQSKSKGDCITAFLVFSNNPIRSSITMTWPSFVFSSFTVVISNHFGRSCEKEGNQKLNTFIQVNLAYRCCKLNHNRNYNLLFQQEASMVSSESQRRG